MKATGFTHVSVYARDIEESVRFYTEFFGMERVPSPEFSTPVAWLRVGNLQLHLLESEDPVPKRQHFGLDVDDFDAAYRKANEMGVLADDRSPAVRELSDGAVQMYLRDPSGNLVEVNWPDVSTLDRTLIPETKKVTGPPGVALYMDR